jgi:hypothetical protein
MVTQINYPNSKFHFTDASTNNVVDLDSSNGLVINDSAGLRTYLTNTGMLLNDPGQDHRGMFSYEKLEYVAGTAGNKSIILSPNTDSGRAHGIKMLSDSNETKYDINSLYANHVYDISLTALTFKSTGSSSGQVIMADANGSPYWATLPAESQSLSSVLTNGADASGTGITNIPSIAFSNGGSTVTVGTAANTLSLNSSLDSATTRAFDSKYLPIVIGGTTYYLPLFV